MPTSFDKKTFNQLATGSHPVGLNISSPEERDLILDQDEPVKCFPHKDISGFQSAGGKKGVSIIHVRNRCQISLRTPERSCVYA